MYPSVVGQEPPARYYHTAVAHGANMYVFGGRSVDGTLLGDLWSYSMITRRWDSISGLPDPKLGYPTPRARHSATANSTHMIIVGGVGTSDSLEELWLFNFNTLQWTGNFSFPLNFSADCTLAMKGEDEVYIAGCANPSSRVLDFGAATSKIDIINLKNMDIIDKQLFIDPEMYFRTGCVLRQISNDTYALFGGTYNGNLLPGLYILQNDTASKIEFRAIPVLERAFSGAVYFGIDFFVFSGVGGRITLDGSKFSPNFAYRDALSLSFSPVCGTEPTEECSHCSRGTYTVGQTCVACPAGQYGDVFGAFECKKCPKGTISTVLGAESKSVCQQCPHRYHTTVEGATTCEKCNDTSNSEFCHVSLRALAQSHYDQMGINYNPVENSSWSDLHLYMYTVGLGSICVLFVLLLIALLLFRFCTGFRLKILKYGDLFFSTAHSVDEDRPIIKHSSVLGALFTLFALGILAILFTTSIIDFFSHNKIYTQTFTQSDTVYLNGSIVVSIDIKGTSDCGGELEVVGAVHSEFQITRTGARTCRIQWTCTNSTDKHCAFQSSIQIGIRVRHPFAEAYQIDYNITVPYFSGNFEYIGDSITAQGEQVFLGSIATEISMLLNPSLFYKLHNLFFAYFGFTRNRRYQGYSIQPLGIRPGSETNPLGFIAADDRVVRVNFFLTVNSLVTLYQERTTQTTLNLIAQLGALVGTVIAILALFFPLCEYPVIRRKKRERRSAADVTKYEVSPSVATIA